MILNADAKALEWVCASFLSQDKTAHKEIHNEILKIYRELKIEIIMLEKNSVSQRVDTVLELIKK